MSRRHAAQRRPEPVFAACSPTVHRGEAATAPTRERKRNERGVRQCICATGERRWASDRPIPGAGGRACAASEGLRSAKNPAVREAPQPRWNSGLPVRWLRCLVVSVVVVSAMALVTKRLSPKHLALPVGRSARRRALGHFGQLARRGQIAGDAGRVLHHGE